MHDMIYTVTLNPAVDRELTVPALDLDTVLRATQQRVDIGGKGFNVSRMIRQLGGKSVALGFVGGNAGKLLSEGLTAQGIETDLDWVTEETRTNTSIVTTSNSHHLKVNESGPRVSSDKLAAFVDKIITVLGNGYWCVMSGSLPPGVPTSFYADLIGRLNPIGVRTILDTSGEALKLGIAAKPFLITPNLDEACEISGQSEPLAAAETLRRCGAENVIITQGSSGATLFEADAQTKIIPPSIKEQNPIGAGDALVGGIVFGLNNGLPLREALNWGVACGTVAASLEGTAFGNLDVIQQMLSQLRAETMR